MTPDYSHSYLSVAVLSILDVLFILGVLGFSRLIQRRHAYPEKLTPYECGVPPIGDARIPFAVRYYIFALLFLIFEVEAVFLFPWAMTFDSLGTGGFVAMMIFIGVLLFGLIYAWGRGALEWV
ncbi:MAG: NADH-quinone oxidoreductase subunit A [Thermoleophilia bacterium]|nr:NADH-quinone oxidoreductase subunit A [Thermoleophilia bacterium]